MKFIHRSTTRSLSVWRALLGPIALLALLCAPAAAQSAADLVKDTNKILRDAERKMYSGKNDEILATGYKGFVAQEFIPAWEDHELALRHAAMLCDV